MRKKVYVAVKTEFTPEGEIIPLSIKWADGNQYIIDKVMAVERRASLKVGGAGIRYTCRIQGETTYLFLEENRWFVEAKYKEEL